MKSIGSKRKKTDKLDFMKIKNFYASKGTIRKVKQRTECEKVFTNHIISDKDLVSRIYTTQK